MTQPIDIITNALTNIGAQAIGEPTDASEFTSSRAVVADRRS